MRPKLLQQGPAQAHGLNLIPVRPQRAQGATQMLGHSWLQGSTNLLLQFGLRKLPCLKVMLRTGPPYPHVRCRVLRPETVSLREVLEGTETMVGKYVHRWCPSHANHGKSGGNLYAYLFRELLRMQLNMTYSTRPWVHKGMPMCV